jgi:hypothetical protein
MVVSQESDAVISYHHFLNSTTINTEMYLATLYTTFSFIIVSKIYLLCWGGNPSQRYYVHTNRREDIYASSWIRTRDTTDHAFLDHMRIRLFFHGAKAPSEPRPPHYRGFTIKLRQTTIGRTPLDERSARRRAFYLTVHNIHKRQKSMPPGGIRTPKTRKRAAVNPRLRPRGHWDWHADITADVLLACPYNCRCPIGMPI